MSELRNRIGIIVFCCNTRSLTTETTLCLIEAASIVPETEFFIVFVNDGSSDDTDKYIEESIVALSKAELKITGFTTGHMHREGLAKSFLTGIQKLSDVGFLDDDFVTQLPGNNQLTAESISKLARSKASNRLVIGWRVNINSRPYPKRVFSRVLQLVINLFFFPGVRQVTANYVSTLKLATDWIKPNSGHAFGVWLIHGALQEKIEIHQEPLILHEAIKQRPSGNSIRKWPRASDISVMLANLFRVYLAKQKKGYKFNS